VYQAAFIPLVSLFTDFGNPEETEKWRGQIKMALAFFSRMESYSIAAKRSRDVVSKLLDAAKSAADAADAQRRQQEALRQVVAQREQQHQQQQQQQHQHQQRQQKQHNHKQLHLQHTLLDHQQHMGGFPRRHLNGISIHNLPTEALSGSPQGSPVENMAGAGGGAAGSMGSISPASFNGAQMGLPPNNTPLTPTPAASAAAAGLGVDFLPLGNGIHPMHHHHQQQQQLHEQQQLHGQQQLHEQQLHEQQLHEQQLHRQLHQHHTTTAAAALAGLQAAATAGGGGGMPVPLQGVAHPQPLGFWDEMVWDTFPDAVEPPGGLPPTGLPHGLAAAAAAAPQQSMVAHHSPTDLGMGGGAAGAPAWPADLPEQPVGSWGFAGPG
jgi:hypothetical protein